MTATLLRSSDHIRSLTVSLGELKLVLPQNVWHSDHLVYKVLFQNGSIEIAAPQLTELVRQAQEALAVTPREVDCSGAYTDMEAM